MRASSCSARLGTIASSSGTVPLERRLLDGEPVRIGRRHDELAARELDEDAGEHRARLVTRRGARDAPDRLEQRLAVDRERRAPRRARAAAGSPRGCTCAACSSRSRRDVHDRLRRLVLDRHLVCRQQARDVGERLARQHDRAVAFDLRRQRRAQRSSMSVAASRSSPPCASSRIPDRICTDVRVETARETTPSAETSSSFEHGNPQTRRPPRCLSQSSYEFLVEVVGSVDDGEDGVRRAWLSQIRPVKDVWRDGGFNRRHGSPDLFHTCGQLLHEVVHRPVLTNQTRDLGGCVDDGRVIAAAELLADLRKRRVRQLA